MNSHIAKMERLNPSCVFYKGVNIDDSSELGRYVVLFRDVTFMNSTIGDNSFVQKQSVVMNADIGKFCSIASKVSIGLGNHPITMVSTHPAFYSSSQPLAKTFSDKDSFQPFKRIEIGHDVWLGQSTMIMDGVTIGTGAVIAAGAVVTKNIPPYAIAAGVPARIIKYRFDDRIIDGLLKSKWWNKSEEWLAKNDASFRDPEKFLALLEKDK